MRNGPHLDHDGVVLWYKDDRLHREEGPAVEYPSGTKCWYRHGRRHRIDGPAIEYSSGACWWYINGKSINRNLLEKHGIDLNNITEEDKLLIMLIFG